MVFNLCVTYPTCQSSFAAEPMSRHIPVAAAGAVDDGADLRDDEIIVSQMACGRFAREWKPGDEIALSYFPPESGARLGSYHEQIPRSQHCADGNAVGGPDPMPDFPGIEKPKARALGRGISPHLKFARRMTSIGGNIAARPKPAFITLAAGPKYGESLR